MPRLSTSCPLLAVLLAACAAGPAPEPQTAKTPDARAAVAAAIASLPASRFDKPGFKAVEADGRLIVFRTDDPQVAAFANSRELGKSVTHVGSGPEGMTISAPDADTLAAFDLARPGFATRIDGGRLWVFAVPSAEWDEFQNTGALVKHVTRVGAGPNGMTIKAADAAVIDAFLAR